MAAKELSYNDIMASIKKGVFAPVYLLMGEETYFLDSIMDALEQNVVSEDDRDFNLTTFYGPDAVIEDVVAAAQQYPVMAERQLVLLKEAQGLERAKQTLDKIEGYMKKPNSQCVLAICFKGDNLNATSPMVKAAVKAGAVVFKSPKIRDYKLGDPIRSYVASKRLNIEPKAVDMLAEAAGSDLAKLFGEIDKLALTVPKGVGTISASMVEDLVGVSKEYNVFELNDAIQRRDFLKAIKIVDHYSKNPNKNSTIPIYSMLFNFFTRLVLVAYAPDKSDAGLMEALELKSPWALKGIREAAANYPGGRPIKIISEIRDADRRSKGVGSFQKEHDILKELIYKIFTM